MTITEKNVAADNLKAVKNLTLLRLACPAANARSPSTPLSMGPPAPKASSPYPSTLQGEPRLHVKNIPFEFSPGQFREHIGQAGALTECHAPTKADGTLQGFAFVRFADAAGTSTAMSWNGSMYGGRPFKIEQARSQN